MRDLGDEEASRNFAGSLLVAHRNMFDPNFRPAYFEDNDYYARVVLGGGRCRVVHAAQFFHHGSMTIKEDPEMA